MDKFNVNLPQIKDNWISILEKGGTPGGVVSNTKAIKEAIESISMQGGGHVVIPSGIWLTGPVELKSGVDLHLEEGAVLQFDKNKEEYPLIITNYEGIKRIRARSPIYANHAHDISITGSGVIDGNGHLWRMVKQYKLTPVQWEEKMKINSNTYFDTKEGKVWFPTESAFEGAKKGEPDIDKLGEEEALKQADPYYDYYRPVMVNLVNCERVLLNGVSFQNSPAWNLHPLFCRHLTLDKVYVHNEFYAQNGDGVDVESCSFVEIKDSVFDVGDDAICLKSGKNEEARKIKIPTEKVRITGCKVFNGHGGFVVGSEMSRGIRDVEVENCTFIGTDIGIRFKSALGRGGVVERIKIKNIQMIRIPNEAAIFSMGYMLRPGMSDDTDGSSMRSEEDIPEFRDIELEGITVKEARIGIKIEGLSQKPIHDIKVKNCEFNVDNSFKMENASRIMLDQVVFRERATSRQVSYDNQDCSLETPEF